MINKKKELLKEYAKKDVHCFTQIDGWIGIEEDCFYKPDRDNDCITWTNTKELRNSGKDLAVRVLIHEGTKKKDIIRLLLKILTIMSSDDFMIKKASGGNGK